MKLFLICISMLLGSCAVIDGLSGDADNNGSGDKTDNNGMTQTSGLNLESCVFDCDLGSDTTFEPESCTSIGCDACNESCICSGEGSCINNTFCAGLSAFPRFGCDTKRFQIGDEAFVCETGTGEGEECIRGRCKRTKCSWE